MIDWTPEMKRTFEAMRKAEMALDDMDYITNSPKIQDAIDAANQWREACDAADRAREAVRR